MTRLSWISVVAAIAVHALPGQVRAEHAAPVPAVLVPSHHQALGAVLYRLDPVPAGIDRLLLARDYDVVRRRSGPEGALASVDVAIWPGQAAVFEHLFPAAEVIEETRGIRSAFAGEPGGSVYASPDEIWARAARLAAEHPDRAAIVDLTQELGVGRTAGGQRLRALRVRPRGAVGDTTLPAAVVVAWLHAREAATPWWGLDLARHVLEQDLGAGREIWFVLCANPDGARHAWHRDRWWRKNRSYNGAASFGTDLNRNFATGFRRSEGRVEVRDRADFAGARAGSEPETRALTRLLEALAPELWVDLHTHGRLVMEVAASRRASPHAARFAAAAGYALVAAPRLGMSVVQAHRHGALALLVEGGDRFQAPSAAVRAEALRLRPAFAELLEACPALRGEVTDERGAPLAAAISVVDGETDSCVGHARARDGRFGLWLGAGQWRLRVRVEGRAPVERTVTIADGPLEPWRCVVADARESLQSLR